MHHCMYPRSCRRPCSSEAKTLDTLAPGRPASYGRRIQHLREARAGHLPLRWRRTTAGTIVRQSLTEPPLRQGRVRVRAAPPLAPLGPEGLAPVQWPLRLQPRQLRAALSSRLHSPARSRFGIPICMVPNLDGDYVTPSSYSLAIPHTGPHPRAGSSALTVTAARSCAPKRAAVGRKKKRMSSNTSAKKKKRNASRKGAK